MEFSKNIYIMYYTNEMISIMNMVGLMNVLIGMKKNNYIIVSNDSIC